MKLPNYSVLLLAALLALTPALFAQQPAAPLTIILKDGRSIVSPVLSRSGDNVMAVVQIDRNTGQVGYPVASIERIEFPEPPQLKVARELFAKGDIPEGAAALAPVIRYFEPFRDVPGSYWARAVTMKLNAWLSVGNEREAQGLIEQLKAVPGIPDITRIAEVEDAAAWARKGQYEKAIAVYDAAIQQSTDRETLALAWLNKGHSLLGLKQWESAALAYLHIPVFFPEDGMLVAPALLGSARAMVGLGDFTGAELRLNDLIKMFPGSREAATAQIELQKLKKKKS
jgi:tetratricopeptide (TPR) repeat protein